jgi:hypothetical protein
MGESSQVCTVETEEQEYLIQLRCWKTAQLEGRLSDMEKTLKHSYASIHLFTDENSALHSLIYQMIDAASTEVMDRGGHHYVKSRPSCKYWRIVLEG